jgi:hypothetical protein
MLEIGENTYATTSSSISISPIEKRQGIRDFLAPSLPN